MTGPLCLLILIAGFLALYFAMLTMMLVTHTPWFWVGGMGGSLGLYFTVFGIGAVKGWWTSAR